MLTLIEGGKGVPSPPARSADEAGREACRAALESGVLAALAINDISDELRRDLESCARTLRAAAGLPILQEAI